MVLPAHLMKPTSEEDRMSEISDASKPMRLVSIDRDEADGGYVATSPDVPGAAGQGETASAAMLDLVAAVEAIRAASSADRGQVYEAELSVRRMPLAGRIVLRVGFAALDVARALVDRLEGRCWRVRTVPLDEVLDRFGVTRDGLKRVPEGDVGDAIVEVAEECEREPETRPLRSLADRLWQGDPPEDVTDALDVLDEAVADETRRMRDALQGVRGVVFGNAADLAPKKRDELRAIHDLAMYGLYGDEADAAIVVALREGRLGN
jgi:hypothetical protein